VINVGLLGLGNVGTGVIALLERNRHLIENRLGCEVIVKRILVQDLTKPRDVAVLGRITDRVDDILGDKEISIVVEVMGGEEPAYSYIKRALSVGKHVVTANKQVIADHGSELTRDAAKAGVSLMFEASVGGGLPVIRPIQECLAANEMTSVMGILNGTTNYILTQMDERGIGLDEALELARTLGYAESDPSDDLNGTDAARKLAILASLAFDTRVPLSQIEKSGLECVRIEDIKHARETGYRVKLVAFAARRGEVVEACVSPALLPVDHPLAQVRDVFNGVILEGAPVGRVFICGRGAGGESTASAVVSDVMQASRANRVPLDLRPGHRIYPVRSPQGVPKIGHLRVWD